MEFEFWIHRIQHALRQPIIGSVIFGLIVLGIASTLWTGVSSLRPLPSLPADQSFQAKPAIPLQQLPDFHLMGAAPTSLDDLPFASLGITLQGIFLDNQGESAAIVQMNDATIRTIHVGDALAPNVTVVKILPDSVVVNHNQKLEKLGMGIQPIDFSSQPTPNGLW